MLRPLVKAVGLIVLCSWSCLNIQMALCSNKTRAVSTTAVYTCLPQKLCDKVEGQWPAKAAASAFVLVKLVSCIASRYCCRAAGKDLLKSIAVWQAKTSMRQGCGSEMKALKASNGFRYLFRFCRFRGRFMNFKRKMI